ncbi:sulfur carrier protein [Nocardioides ginsengisegetis]|uniref:Sulfur carrier protein n=1 Tax=Nocardioides ginsengisegetis TaxID=661491 RepID=A0A7W3IXI5_9ACTN|nr:sulfur carrier protein ThiS [Nocardioides ginsengisegetis]MBA8802472.1 sulfur carrier protein [Nocardioides ginsengisegetis]
MSITLNGEPSALEPGSTVADLLADWRGVAVAVNGEVVPRERHPATALHDGDVVEVVTAVQGG